MPSQLVNNDNVSFICARSFTYAGVDYALGEDFDQDIAIGRIEQLVRTGRVIPVVEDSSVKPRHFYREVRIRADVLHKLGVEKGESLHNKPQQFGDAEDQEKQLDSEDTASDVQGQAEVNFYTEAVLAEENEEKPVEDDEETEPEPLVHPAEIEENEDHERVITAEDLYDPTSHGVEDVLEYLDSDISDNERQRVIAVERAGKARKGILNHV